jgi:hypothetical protein
VRGFLIVGLAALASLYPFRLALAGLSPLEITEEDASPSTFPYQIKFANGTLTDNGDGTVSVAGGGGSGDITSVGDVASGAAFDGTQGSSLVFTPSSGNQWEHAVGPGYYTLADYTTGLQYFRLENQTSSVFLPQGKLIIGDLGTTASVLSLSGSDLTLRSKAGLNLKAPSGVDIEPFINMAETTEPSTPSSNNMRIWVEDTAGKERIHVKGSAGNDFILARDNAFIARNNTASIITKGTIVYINGQQGNARPSVAPADADAEATMPAVGIAFEEISVNGDGYILSTGIISGIATSGAGSAGDRVWVSQTAGEFTGTRPAMPAFSQQIGVIITSHASNGKLYVNLPATVRHALATEGSILFANADGLLAQDNANLFWDDSANSLGIGTTSPDSQLDVEAAVPAIRWTDSTASHDDFEAVAEASTFRLVNVTDGITSLIHYASNAIGLGEVGMAPSHIELITDGTGDGEVRLPTASIGLGEVSVSNTPTAGQFLSHTGGNSFTWSSPSGSGDVTAASNLDDNTLIRGDGGTKGVQHSGITVDDSNNVTGVGTLGVGAITTTGTLDIQATTPTVKWTPSSGDSYEQYVASNLWYLTNVTDGAVIARTTQANGFQTVGKLTTEGGADLNGTVTFGQPVDASYLDDDVRIGTVGITIDGGGSAITTGVKGYIAVPYNCTIIEATMLADTSGSAVVDVWKDAYANYPPTVADTITASAKPTISAAVKSKDTTLTGWTTTITAGDTIGFNVDSASTITRLHVLLKVRKT